MGPRIGTLTIERFRAFRTLRIEGLGRVNLITGRNNTGKSSVLEALRILASNASPSVIRDILRFREENAGKTEELALALDAEGSFPMGSLFHGFPEFSAKLEPIVIASNGGQHPVTLSLEAGWFSEEPRPDGSKRLVSQQPELLGEGKAFPALVVTAGGVQYPLPLDALRRHGILDRPSRSGAANEPRLPCIFVSPYGEERTATLGPLWDKIALSDREEDVIEALRIIDPSISAVSMVGGEGSRQSRIAIVRLKGVSHAVPLRSFGDGLNRLFRIILSLVNAKDGLLLIDEFENGMDYTVQADAWRAVFKLASHLDIQVVATSHSWDAIEGFQKAASETAEEGVLVRLSRKGEDIIPTVFREDELVIATRDRIEVR
jgi:energy-coupling factor transporter ATP-binding protein EcfA2